MTKAQHIKRLSKALTKIRNQAMSNPMFDRDAFNKRDIKWIKLLGGEIRVWTMIAVIADDALNGK